MDEKVLDDMISLSGSIGMDIRPKFHSFGLGVGYMENDCIYLTENALESLKKQVEEQYEMKEDNTLPERTGVLGSFSGYPIFIKSESDINFKITHKGNILKYGLVAKPIKIWNYGC